MTQGSTPEERIRLAAQRLKEDLAFQYTMQYLRTGYLDGIAASDDAQTAHREALYHRIKALDDIQATLRNLAQTADKGDD